MFENVTSLVSAGEFASESHARGRRILSPDSDESWSSLSAATIVLPRGRLIPALVAIYSYMFYFWKSMRLCVIIANYRSRSSRVEDASFRTNHRWKIRLAARRVNGREY